MLFACGAGVSGAQELPDVQETVEQVEGDLNSPVVDPDDVLPDTGDVVDPDDVLPDTGDVVDPDDVMPDTGEIPDPLAIDQADDDAGKKRCKAYSTVPIVPDSVQSVEVVVTIHGFGGAWCDYVRFDPDISIWSYVSGRVGNKSVPTFTNNNRCNGFRTCEVALTRWVHPDIPCNTFVTYSVTGFTGGSYRNSRGNWIGITTAKSPIASTGRVYHYCYPGATSSFRVVPDGDPLNVASADPLLNQ